MHQIRPSRLEQHSRIHHANTLAWNQEKRELITHPEKMYNLKQNNSEWSGLEIKCLTLFFCLFYSFLHQQSNLRPHDICQSFQTLLENTYRSMHTNTISTGWKLRVLNSVIYQQFNYLVTKYFPPQYSSVNGLILINNIWWQRETKHRLTDIFHVFCGEKICRRPVQTEMSFFSISNYFKLNE